MEAAGLLRRAERPLRVLRAIQWHPRIAERFFARGARALPRVKYELRDATPTIEGVRAAMRRIEGLRTPEARWLRRQARAIRGAADMLSVVGTPKLHERSAALYGTPAATMLDDKTTTLALARRLDATLGNLDPEQLGPAPRPLTARQLARRLRVLVRRPFGADAPRVVISKTLSAKLVAGPRRIRVRATADFTEDDVVAMLAHEALVHVATSLNGRRQRRLPILASGHPGTTRTQEGLAVFSELVMGTLSPARFRRLTRRVLAIQMAMEGADFLDVYRFFVERTDEPAQSFEDTRRVFRGAPVTGGSPFTKDNVYLDGLLRVHNFLRSAVQLGRVDVLPLLFCGKLDVEDVPIVGRMLARGLVRPPRYLPPWVERRGMLVSYLAYSGFLDRVRLTPVRHHYAELLEHTPREAPGG